MHFQWHWQLSREKNALRNSTATFKACFSPAKSKQTFLFTAAWWIGYVSLKPQLVVPFVAEITRLRACLSGRKRNPASRGISVQGQLLIRHSLLNAKLVSASSVSPSMHSRIKFKKRQPPKSSVTEEMGRSRLARLKIYQLQAHPESECHSGASC